MDAALTAVLFLFGTAVGAWLALAWPRPAVQFDAVEYLKLGQSLASGLGYRYGLDSYPTAYRPPLYPFLLAAVFLPTGGALYAAYLLQAVLHGATVAATYALAQFVLPRPYAVIAAMLAALSIGLTSLVGYLMTETVQAALTTAGMATLPWWLRAMTVPRAALSGVLWGMGALTKGTNLVFLALLPVVLLLGWRREWRRWLPGYAVAWAVALAVMAPWTLRNWALFGRPVFVSTNVGIQLYISTLDPVTWDSSDPRLKSVYDEASASNLNEADTDRLFLQRGLARLAADPAALLTRMQENAWKFWEVPPRDSVHALKPTILQNDLPEYQRVVLWHQVMLWAVGAGLALAAVLRRRELLMLWTVPVGVTLVYAPFWVIYRFTAQAIPVLIIIGVSVVWLLTVFVVTRSNVRAPFRNWRAGVQRMANEAARSALAAATLATVVVFWQAHRPGWMVESEHPYRPNSDLVWAFVNPDGSAQQTRLHFSEVQLVAPGDRLVVLDRAFNVVDELDPSTFAQGGWTRPYPGGFVVLKLLSDGAGEGWGFRVDGLDSGG